MSGILGMPQQNINYGMLGLQNPMHGAGGHNASQNANPMAAPQPGMLIPGSPAHALAFHAKGPDYEIKLFVGGLAF